MAHHRSIAVAFVLYITSVARGLIVVDFYPFGKLSGDAQLRFGFHKLVNLSTAVVFHGEVHRSLYVNSNGALSFHSPAPLSISSQDFPIDYKLIAPFYTKFRTSRRGKVFYRETREARLLVLASDEVHAAIASERKFEATSLFIATWIHVSQRNDLRNKTFSFQVVLISDGKKTFALFHYNHEANKRGTDTFNSQQAVANSFPKTGFSYGDMASKFYLPNSATSDVFRLSETSNIHIPGKWLYMASSRGVIQPDVRRGLAEDNIGALSEDVTLNDRRGRRSSSDVCGETETRCHKDGVCVKTPTECCVCNNGYYGNGEICFKNNKGVHMTGTLFGRINGISLDRIKCSVFGDVPSKTTHTALEPVPASVAFSLRVLMPIVSTFGFFFAHPSKSSGNGFSLLGDGFLRRSQVKFETGEVCNIRESIVGKDQQRGSYKFDIELNGNVPVFDTKASIAFQDYVHTFRYDRPGIVSGYYRSTFISGGKKHKINVVEVLDFDEKEGCVNVGSSKMAVSEQRSRYNGKSKVLNFALKTEMKEEEGCGEEKRKCHRQAKCVVKNGVEFCNCNIGFHGDGFSCRDVDECLLNIHDCSPHADCIDVLGSFNCKCRDGFVGDGKNCLKEDGRCGDEATICHSLAQCVTSGEEELCECNIGYIGDGKSCQDADECALGIDLCAVNADCLNTPGSYVCRCKEGYTGDGQTCQGIPIGSGDVCTPDARQCDPAADCIKGKCQCRNGFLYDGSACKDANECELGIHSCAKTASCQNTVGSFKCTCNEGYIGTGYKCVLEGSIPLDGCRGKQCHDDGYCDRSGNAPVCRCKQGYDGDGVSCQDVNECENGKSSCHGYATCSNTIGSYTCRCRPGYKGDGRQCVYEDPCDDSCSPYARCIVRESPPRCQCFSGYYGDGKFCKDFNECEAKRDLCDQNAKCVNTLGSYICFCLPGYHGDGFSCQSDGSCGGSKCHRNAECVEIDGARQCQCKSGFLGSGLICVDINECSNATLVQCPQFSHCFNTPGSYQCRCDPGYKWNGVECKSVCLRCLNGGQCLKSGCLCREGFSGERCQWVGDEFLVFTQGSTMQRLSLPPKQETIGVLLQSSRGLLVALDFDHMNKMIYFTDVARKAIWRVGFNGTGTKKIISERLSSPEGIAVDYVGGNLYWTDSTFDRVEVSKLDGSDRKVLFSARLINPRSIVVHPEKGTMYWADWYRAAPKIEVANMDGGSRRVFIQQKMGLPNGLTLDRRNDELCWTDAMYGSISCANLDDSRSQVMYSAARYPFGITSFGQYLIWTDWDARTIQQYDRQSFKLQTPIKSFRGSSGSFYEIKAVQKPQDIESHECKKNNGGCSSLCLPKPGGRSCACANGFHLVSEEESARLKSRGSGFGSGSGTRFQSGSGLGSAFASGFGSGNIPQPQSTAATSLNGTLIGSTKTVCINEDTYKLLRGLS